MYFQNCLLNICGLGQYLMICSISQNCSFCFAVGTEISTERRKRDWKEIDISNLMRKEGIWPSPIRVTPGKWILKMHCFKTQSDWINTVVLNWGPCCSCVQVIWQCLGIVFHCHIWGTREGYWHLQSKDQQCWSTSNRACRMVSITMNYPVPSVSRVKTGKAWINDKFFVNPERFFLAIYGLKYMFEVSFGFIQTLQGALLQCSCFHLHVVTV